VTDDIRIAVSASGDYLDATPAALELLGVTLDELQASTPGRFAPEPTDPAEGAAFREQWESAGSPDLVGHGTIRRADGHLVQVDFAITGGPERYVAVLRPIDIRTADAPQVFTIGEVLARWRAAERRLEEIPPDAPESAGLRSDIDDLRRLHRRLFDSKQGRSDLRAT
jgi:PAS domain-containing protein